MIVLVSHSAEAGLLPWVLGPGTGHMGVVMFFVLSGFLMAYLYADRPFESGELDRYARHRIGRVIPLFLAIVLLSWALWGRYEALVVFAVGRTSDLRDHLLLLRGDQTLWTIPVELHFYLVFVVLWYANARGRPLVGILAAAIVFGGLLVFADSFRTADVYLPYWAHFFLFGTCIGLLWRRHHARVESWVQRRPAWSWLGWLVMLATIAAAPHIRSYFGLPIFAHWCDPLTAGMPVAFFLCALVEIGPFKALAWRPLRWLGDISYGVYVLHWPILMTIAKLWPVSSWLEGLGVFAIVVAAVIASATISYRFLERPAQRLINRRWRPVASSSESTTA